MKVISFLLIFLTWGQFSLAAAMTPPAQEELRSQNYRLIALLKLSGIKDVLGNIESIVQMSINIREDELSPWQFEFAREIFRRAYSSGKFYYALRQPLKKGYQPKHARSVVKWYRSVLGKKILKLETEANDPVNRARLEAFIRKIMQSPPGDKRIKLVEMIESSAHVTKASQKLYLGYAKLILPFNKNFKGTVNSKILRSKEESIIETMRTVVLHNLLFSYRNLKDAELEKYARFLNSDAGRWFSKLVIKGFNKATQKVLYKAGLLQEELLKEIKSGGPNYPLLKDIVPPGQRYLLIGKRDPFQPLVNKKVPIKLTEVGSNPFQPLTNKKGMVELKEVELSKSKARLFGGELKDIPPLALLVFEKIEDKHPKLYRELKHFERLFKNQNALKEMGDAEYAQAVSDYRDVLEKTSDIRMDESPLQVDYNSLRMTGIIQKKLDKVAMFEIDTAGYAVKKGDRVGPFFGYVEEIQSDQVIVIEVFRDYLGNILENKKIIQFSQRASSEGNTSS